MRHLKLTCFLALIALLLSCQKVKEGEKKITRSKDVNGSAFRSIDKLGLRFYQDVVKTHSSPLVKIDTDGAAYLDIDAHIDTLRDLGIFSASFFEEEKARFEECAKDIAKLNYKPTPSEEIAWEPKSCSFLYYMFWYNAQEKPDTIDLQKKKIEEDKASLEMHFYTNSSPERHYWDEQIYLKMIMQDEGGQWKIESVKRVIP